jgi:hypothetical protein
MHGIRLASPILLTVVILLASGPRTSAGQGAPQSRRASKSADGRTLPNNCTLCHTVLAQLESGVPLMKQEVGVAYKHSTNIGKLTDADCNSCHKGGAERHP